MRMRAMAVAAALIWASAAPANAGMELAFRNTVVSRYASGLEVRHWFNRDGTYEANFSDGRKMTGRWTEEGKKVCLNDIRPRMIMSRFCTPAVSAEIGGTWTSRDPLGRRVQNVLVAGR